MKKAPARKPARPGKVTVVPAGTFKARCLALVDEVRDHHCEVVITKRGKPAAKLVPFEDNRPDIFGYLRGSVVIHGDIVGPTGEVWDADT